MSRNPLSREREDYISRQTDLHNGRIERAQSRLWRILRDGILAGIITEPDGTISRTANNDPYLAAKIEDIYRQFVSDEIMPITAKLESGFAGLASRNAKYFDSVKPSEEHDAVRSSVFGALGIGGGTLAAGSAILSVLRDPEAMNVLKNTILSAVFGGITITALKIAVETIVTKVDGGIVKKLFDKTMPDPYVRVDRFIGNTYAQKLELTYAMYQGGLIGTSRPFCRERNNRVFSREEIARFGTPADQYGGYENKSTGDFQGKPKVYNPFTDCGGFNCRHQLDWISDELAQALRPDLPR